MTPHKQTKQNKMKFIKNSWINLITGLFILIGFAMMAGLMYFIDLELAILTPIILIIMYGCGYDVQDYLSEKKYEEILKKESLKDYY